MELLIKSQKQAWARLIKKIYEIDPLVCPKCSSEMKIIACLEKKNKVPPVVENLS
jgi:hypothetical protein